MGTFQASNCCICPSALKEEASTLHVQLINYSFFVIFQLAFNATKKTACLVQECENPQKVDNKLKEFT